jgi:hypothetical protein
LNDLAKWDVEKQTETATPVDYSYICVDPTGDTTTTKYYNQTAAQMAAAIAASPIIYRKSMDWQINKFNLFDGHIQTVNNTGFTWGVWRPDLTESEVKIVQRDGQTFKHVFTYTYDYKKNMGVSAGRAEYSGAKTGSKFEDLAGDWYEYKKVTQVQFSEAVWTGAAGNPWTNTIPLCVIE